MFCIMNHMCTNLASFKYYNSSLYYKYMYFNSMCMTDHVYISGGVPNFGNPNMFALEGKLPIYQSR